MGPDTFLPIIAVRAGDLPEAMVVVGDPARAAKASALLEDPRPLGRNREFVSFRGVYRGTEVGVISHGVGAAGAATCFEELCRGGVRRIIRAGTAGGMQPGVADGELVVASGAVRADGYTSGIVPQAYPAVADRRLTAALVEAAGEIHEGIVLTTAVFYPHDVLGSSLRRWQKAGVVAVEMETSALFVVAALHGVAAGAILAIDGNPLAEEDADMSGYDPHRDIVRIAVDHALQAAFTALA